MSNYMGIPKKIHYCWFGRNPKSELIEKCIQSWRDRCPDYEIIEWNESNCQLNDNLFIKQAYESKKWAFVSDVIRLKVLYEHGGFYLDTDVEILANNPFEQYRKYKNVLVFESEIRIATGLFCGAQKSSAVMKALLSSYEDLAFKGDRTQINVIVNLPVIQRAFPSLCWSNANQVIEDTYFMSSKEYSPKMYHYGVHSWLDDKVEYKPVKKNKVKRIIQNPKVFNFLIKSKFGRKILPCYEFVCYDLIDMGPMYFIKLNCKKIKRKFQSK